MTAALGGDGRTASDVARSESRGGRGATVPDVEFRSYHGQPVLKEPVWTWEIPWYFFTGGLAGASSLIAAAGRLAGHDRLAAAALRTAAAGAAASPALLVADLGRPARFFNMLRVLRPTSPMSVGSWLLAAYAPAAVGAWMLRDSERLPLLQRLAESVAAALGAPLTSYTAALVADTAVPVWHEARRELPFVFAAGAASSAGAAGAVALPAADAAPARRIALAGAAVELASTRLMERRLGSLGRPYGEERAGRWAKAARALTAAGGGVLALAGRRRTPAVLGGGLVLAGVVATRWAVFRAGFQSAADPEATVRPQRERLEGKAPSSRPAR